MCHPTIPCVLCKGSGVLPDNSRPTAQVIPFKPKQPTLPEATDAELFAALSALCGGFLLPGDRIEFDEVTGLPTNLGGAA